MEFSDRLSSKPSNVPAFLAIALLITCVCQMGCNSSAFPVAKVSGTIKSEDGELLPSGLVRFTPLEKNAQGMSGKQAFGEIKDGKFVMSTYDDGDGAIIGRHKVTLTESWREDEEYDEGNSLPAPPKHGCEISPDFEQIEIVSGNNVLELIAVPKTKQAIGEDDD